MQRRCYNWSTINNYYKDGHTKKECLEYFNISNGVWERGMAKGDITPLHNGSGIAKYPKVNWSEVQKFYMEGNPQRICLLKFNITSGQWAGARQRKKIFKAPATMKNKQYILRKPLKEILTINSLCNNINGLKKQLILSKLLEEKCYGVNCNITTMWLNKPLVLQLEHINGNRLDNRIENLSFLCPNCHSQTATYAGKNLNNPNRVKNVK